MDVGKALQALVTICTATSMQQSIFHYIFAWSRLSAMLSSTCATPTTRSKASALAVADLRSAVFADAIFFDRALWKNELPFKKDRRHFFSRNSRKKHSRLRTSFIAYIISTIQNQRVGQSWSLLAFRIGRRAVAEKTQTIFPSCAPHVYLQRLHYLLRRSLFGLHNPTPFFHSQQRPLKLCGQLFDGKDLHKTSKW